MKEPLQYTLISLSSILMFSFCGSKENDQEQNSPNEIISCFQEHFETEGLSYQEALDETVFAMNELNFPIKEGKKEDLITVLLEMKSGSFPSDVNMESEAVASKLKIWMLQACVYEFRNDPRYNNVIKDLDVIVVNDVHTKGQFNQMVENTIKQLNSYQSLPVWSRPFMLHLSTLFYTQYWRINNPSATDTVTIQSDTLSDYPPPPPVAPPPPPPIEEIIEYENEEEVPEPYVFSDSI